MSGRFVAYSIFVRFVLFYYHLFLPRNFYLSKFPKFAKIPEFPDGGKSLEESVNRHEFEDRRTQKFSKIVPDIVFFKNRVCVIG